MGQHRPGAAPADEYRAGGRIGGCTGCGRRGVVHRSDEGGGFAGAGCIACDQWSLATPVRATLVRHLFGAAQHIAWALRTLPSAPARGASGMPESAAWTTLIALGGLPSPLAATRKGAFTAAILLAVVAMRAQQHLVTAACTLEQAGRTVHGYLGRQAKGCWTDSSRGATLLLHRLYRHGVGRGAVPSLLALVTVAVPTYFGIVGVVQPALAHVTGGATVAASGPAPAWHPDPFNEIAFACLAALGRPGRRTSCVLVRHQQAKTPHGIA